MTTQEIIKEIPSSNETDGPGTALAHQLRLSDVVAEYDRKLAAIPQVIADFEAAGTHLKTAVSIGGTYGRTSINTGSIYDSTLKESLLKSAWHHVYDGLSIGRIASANDKKRFEHDMTKPAPFTMDNIREAFGNYLLDPRANILRGLAEVFSDLDPAFKSHDKVKIGAAGLPKRVIVGYCNSSYGYGRDKVRDILNALAAYQRKPMVEYAELEELWRNETALLMDWEATDYKTALSEIA